MAIGYPYLKDVAPALVVELQHLLFRDGSPTLASQVAELLNVARCRCGDNFCATFYTTQRARGPFGPGLPGDNYPERSSGGVAHHVEYAHPA
jgi:hypothetical protein